MSKPLLSKKLQSTTAVKDSIWVTVNSLVAKHGAVNLGQGFPDYDGSKIAIEAAKKAIDEGNNQYPPPIGVVELRKAVSSSFFKQTNILPDFETEVTITVGASEALYVLCSSLLNPDDEVILIQPFFDIYLPGIELTGAIIKTVDLHPPTFNLRKEELEKAFSDKTKLIVINSPHNPTGQVFSLEEMTWICDLVIKYNCYLISDEVYEHLVFKNYKHYHPASFKGMWERTFTVSSSGKTFSLTGWKIGWVIAPAKLQSAIRALKQYTTFAGSKPLQIGISAAINNELYNNNFISNISTELEKKSEFLSKVLNKCGLTVHLPKGGYFLIVSNFGFKTGIEFVEYLIINYKVAAIPLGPFYLENDQYKGNNFVRFCFSKKWETLYEAEKRLLNFHVNNIKINNNKL
jgi:aspartate/methionine/tyrosine aminotransferase